LANGDLVCRAVLPGLIAHESAVRGGELLEVPDFGDAGGKPRQTSVETDV